MYRIILATGLMVISGFILASSSSSKYHRGDCITPILETYSWYGKYAIVEAFSVIEGFANEKSYILAFPFNGSNSAIFSSRIEPATKKVTPELCLR